MSGAHRSLVAVWVSNGCSRELREASAPLLMCPRFPDQIPAGVEIFGPVTDTRGKEEVTAPGRRLRLPAVRICCVAGAVAAINLTLIGFPLGALWCLQPLDGGNLITGVCGGLGARRIKMRVATVTCLNYGLVLTVECRDVSPEWTYDQVEWRRRCKQRNFGDPCWCVLRAAREGNCRDADTGSRDTRLRDAY